MRKWIVSAALLSFFFAGPLAAQNTFGFGAHAGVSIPTGDYGDTDLVGNADAVGAELGFLGGLDLWYPLSMAAPGLSWYTSVDAIAHSIDEEGVDGGFFYLPIMTGLRFDIPVGPVAPFVTGQLGLILNQGPSLDFGQLGEADSEMAANFGFNFGAGVQITQNIYAGLKYYPLGELGFAYEDVDEDVDLDVSFLDIYVGFGVN